jgi:hypothetical protein
VNTNFWDYRVSIVELDGSCCINFAGLAASGSSLLSWFRQTLLTCLKNLQDANGLGLKAVTGEDYCRVVIQYPSDTVSKWVSAFLLCYRQSFYLIRAGLSPFQPY